MSLLVVDDDIVPIVCDFGLHENVAMTKHTDRSIGYSRTGDLQEINTKKKRGGERKGYGVFFIFIFRAFSSNRHARRDASLFGFGGRAQ